MSCGNYVVAAGDSFVQMIDRYLYLYGGNSRVSERSINKALKSTINKVLYSFGAEMNYATKRIPKRRVERFLEKIKDIRYSIYMTGTELYLDSGGFQIMSRDLSMSARTSFEIQRQIGDIGLILDVPPLLRENITSKATTSLVPTNSQRFFEECLKKTKLYGLFYFF